MYTDTLQTVIMTAGAFSLVGIGRYLCLTRISRYEKETCPVSRKAKTAITQCVASVAFTQVFAWDITDHKIPCGTMLQMTLRRKFD